MCPLDISVLAGIPSAQPPFGTSERNRPNVSICKPALSVYTYAMPSGPYFTTDPISLTLAADHAFTANLESPDIVWQLDLEPAQPLSLQTSLGLQAQSFRIFTSVGRNKHVYHNLHEYLSTPRIDSLGSNYARVNLSPDPETQANFEFWAREPYAISGCITLRNTGSENAEMSARVAGLLVPLDGGQGLSVTKLDYKTYMRGQSGELTVALVMDGMPKAVISPNQALEISQLLLPGEEFSVAWRCSLALSSTQSQERAIKPFPANWQAEVARLEVADQARTLEIETPLHDWNLVFKSIQDQANLLIKQPEDNPQALTFFDRRNTHSLVGKALERMVWSSNPEQASVLEIRQFVRALLPAQVQTAVELVRGVLNSPQCKYAPPFPQLAALVWDVHTYHQQPQFLAECLPLLAEQTLRWFSPQHDRDQDALPEWPTPDHARLTDLINFDVWQEASLPTRISSVESLGLAILLSNELETLQRMTRVLGDEQLSAQIRPYQERIAAAIDRFRADQPHASFIDRDTHRVHPSVMISEVQLPDPNWQSMQLETPARLNILLNCRALCMPGDFQVVGADSEGRELRERIESSAVLWLPHGFHATTQSVFSRFDRLEKLDINNGSVQVYTSNLLITDISQQLGWEGQSGEEELPAWTAPQDFRYRFGLPTDLNPANAGGGRVNIGWNCLLIEHLNRIGEKKLAFDLLSRLMLGSSGMLKREHTLMEGFTSDSSLCWGNRNSIRGLLPPLLLLEVAGTQIINEQKVSISGENPCPWPLIVRYRGLEVRREGKNTTIQFPDGTLAHHFGSSSKLFTA